VLGFSFCGCDRGEKGLNHGLSRWALKIVVGAREQGTGNRKRVLSDFTFLHIPLNFSVHLLTCLLNGLNKKL